MIIGISGKIGAGKDTIVNDFIENNKTLNISKFRFGDEVKIFCMNHLGLPWEKLWGSQKEKNELSKYSYEHLSKFFYSPDYKNFAGRFLTYRQIMQIIGDGLRKIDTECWVRPTLDKIYQHNRFLTFSGQRLDDFIFISDIRYKTEANKIREIGGKIVRLTRFLELSMNPSETDMDDYVADYLIDNKNMSKYHQLKSLERLLNV